MRSLSQVTSFYNPDPGTQPEIDFPVRRSGFRPTAIIMLAVGLRF